MNVYWKTAWAAMCALAWPAFTWAAAYPVKPIRFIVPFTPGGSQDVIARLLGQKVIERVGQQVVIDTLYNEMHAALQLPDVRQRLDQLGSEIVGDGPQAFAHLLTADFARWAKVIKGANLKLD